MPKIRAAVEADIPAITEIYNQAVLRATGTFDTEPKTLEQQREWFALHGASYPVIVAEDGRVVIGWASLSHWSDRCAYARTAEVSVYIDERARGRGVGGELLDAVLVAGRAAGLREVLARITEGNEASLRLHIKRGFAEVGRLRKVGEKFGRLLDVHMLQKSLLILVLLLVGLPVFAGVDESLRESVLRLTAGDVAGARAKAEEAVASAPNDPRAQEQLGNVALASLDAAAAEEAATQALSYGETPARLILRVNARIAGGNYEGARSDAQRAVLLSPGSGRAHLALAMSLEVVGRPASEVLRQYRRARELDGTLAVEVESAERRLAAPARRASSGARLGPVLVMLILSVLFGWIWSKTARAKESVPPAPPRPLLPGIGLLSTHEALEAITAAVRRGAPDSRALAEVLYERLTGRPVFPREADRALGRYPEASRINANLPEGIDAFFMRALDPNPARRFQTADELVGAFRSLVDPAIL